MIQNNNGGTATTVAARYSITRRHHNSPTAMDHWLAWCEDSGVVAPALILFEWVRTNAPHKCYNNKSLGVMLKDDCIHIKDWTTGECFTFFDDKPLTTTQRQEQQEERKRLIGIAEAQRLADYRNASAQADKLWSEAMLAPVGGYFVSKGLSSTHGARWHLALSCWLVLVTDIESITLTIQKIYNKPPPNKFYLKGGCTRDSMAVIGELDTARQVLVAEGFATACTLREETGKTVIAALSGYNLKPVCKALKERFPDLEIIICGDDDHRSDHNTGRMSAEDAARSTGARVCFPTFCDNCTSCTDFNDVVVCEKRQAVLP